MTVKLYLFAVLLGLSAAAQAQTSPSSGAKASARFENLLGNQSVYLGIMGSGIGISANYDIRFSANQLGWGIYAGIGYMPGLDDQYSKRDSSKGDWYMKHIDYPNKLTIPFGVSYLMGNAYSRHRVEFGLGATYMNGDAELFDQKTTGCTWLLMPKFAYRCYYFNNHFMWRVGLTPIISLSGSGYPMPWLEGGVGIRF